MKAPNYWIKGVHPDGKRERITLEVRAALRGFFTEKAPVLKSVTVPVAQAVEILRAPDGAAQVLKMEA